MGVEVLECLTRGLSSGRRKGVRNRSLHDVRTLQRTSTLAVPGDSANASFAIARWNLQQKREDERRENPLLA